MKITKEQLRALLGFVAKTADEEISCQTCEDQLSRFAEAQLTGDGVPGALQAIQKHLEICPECTEELEYICEALNDDLCD
ncbi:hypothetical protein [Stieleria mannarensis]|uniref:hypothetical protein n=1 Tax=Stieleria mannarensis TaxID=2755585 RepID=UPI0015FFD8B3|nr:hypothetical protein [Rhodopirellula sp. JC639]